MKSIFKFSENRILELDGLRGFALLMVLSYHLINNPILLVKDPNALQIILRKLTFLTYSALDLFFVMSGFLIAKILIENKGSKQFFKVFYVRRILRIVPVYYLLLVSYLILKRTGIQDPEGVLFQNELPIWTYFAYIQNYVMAYFHTYGARIITPTWSLGVDEQFYLMIPLMIFFLKKKWLPYLVIPLIIAAPFFRASTDLYYMKILPFQMRMDSFFVGVLLAYLILEFQLLDRLRAYKKLIIGTIVFIATLILILSFSHRIGVLDHSLFNLLYAFLLIVVLDYKKSWLGMVLRSKVLRFFGLISYGVYLFHQFISGILHAYFLNQQPRLENIEDALMALIVFIFSSVVGYVLYIFLEKPLIKFGHGYKYN